MESRLLDLHVALPGKVISYNAETQTADIQPMVRRPVPTPDEDSIQESLPVIPSVPVIFQRGGGFYITVPIEAGDTVLLVFCERDFAEWYRTGENTAPSDVRLHSLAHAVCFPGFYPSTSPLDSSIGNDLRIGSEAGIEVRLTSSQLRVAGNSDAAALASKVDALASAFNAHTHTHGAGAGTTAPTAPGYTGGASGSAVLKVGS